MHALFFLLLIGNSCPLHLSPPGDSSRFLLQTLEVDQPLSTLAFSHDGNLLATAGEGSTIYLFHPDLGIVLRTMVSQQPEISCLAFSPDNSLLATGGSDNTIVLWDLNSGEVKYTLQVEAGGSSSLSFSTDGSQLLGASGKSAQIWEVATGRRLHQLQHDHSVKHVCFNPDGTQIISSCSDHVIYRWHIDSGYTLNSYIHHSQAVEALEWSPIPNLLASGSTDQQLVVWSPDRQKPYLLLAEEESAVSTLAFGGSGSLLATATRNNRIKIWDLANELPIVEIAQLDGLPIRQLAFSPLGNTLASCGPDGTIHLWEIPGLAERLDLLMEAQVQAEDPPTNSRAAERQRVQLQRRSGRQRRLLEKRLVDYYEKQLDWRRAFSLGLYDNERQQFRIHSPVLGELFLIVPPEDALLVIEQAHLLEYRYLDFEIENNELHVQSATAYLRGMNRRYQTSERDLARWK
ncbi:MAG: WD40 repeat domain-containing protein [Bacteroidota bacterium]